jgi:hypothetical protein
MKIRPEEAELLHVGGRSGGHTFDEANSRFPDFCERALKRQTVIHRLPSTAISSTRLTS